LIGPSLLIWPCGRWAELQAIGSVVSISKFNQYEASSTSYRRILVTEGFRRQRLQRAI
jgi:hypothetical protein